MDAKEGNRPLRTSDRLRQRRKLYGRSFYYYKPVIRKKSKNKKRTAASQIVKRLHEKIRAVRNPNSDVRKFL